MRAGPEGCTVLVLSQDAWQKMRDEFEVVHTRLSKLAHHTMGSVLKKISVFNGIPAAKLGVLSSLFSYHLVNKGSIICREGSYGDSMYIIAEGSVRISAEGMRSLLSRSGIVRVSNSRNATPWATPVQEAIAVHVMSAARASSSRRAVPSARGGGDTASSTTTCCRTTLVTKKWLQPGRQRHPSAATTADVPAASRVPRSSCRAWKGTRASWCRPLTAAE